MKDHPILFNGEMVRAILDGRKTQTRRLVPGEIHINSTHTSFHWHKPRGGYMERHSNAGSDLVFRNILGDHCPYGVPGDLLWVRETWRINSVGYYCRTHKANHNINIEFAALPGDARGDDINICGDEDMLIVAHKYYDKHTDNRASPSIHMPKWACRLWLKVKAVRVERVQEISQEDALAEGVSLDEHDITCMGDCANRHCDFIGDKTLCDIYHTDKDCPETEAFGMLWDSINAKRGYSWEVNPWVWVIEFERIDK